MSRTVIDLGAGDNPDPRATATHDRIPSVSHDYQFDLEDDWEIEDDSADGLIANHVVEHLGDREHFFQEARRVLDDGWLEITLPVGRDAAADPDHELQPEYWTPLMWCEDYRQESGRLWNTETGFRLTNRELDVWLLGPFQPLSGVFNQAAQLWPAWGVRRCGSGELTARYEVVA